MSLQSEIAFAHQQDRIRLGNALANRSVALWRQMNIDSLEAGWDAVAPAIVRQVSAAQLVAVSQSASYLHQLDRSYQGFRPRSAAVNPGAFADVMGDGREVAPALYGAVTKTKTLIGAGMAAGSAFEAGARFIALIASAALNDLGRSADRTLAAGKGYTSYIRVVSSGACSRCAVLAGKYSAEKAFDRHPHCQCTTCPIPGEDKSPAGFHDSPDGYFESLSKAEQDRTFTNAGAEAIRNGADPVRVVNARRGANGIQYAGTGNIPTDPSAARRRLTPVDIGVKADGSPLRVYTTAEGRYRGEFAKSESNANRYTRAVRVMPEQIMKMAGNDPVKMRLLLKRYGYLN